MHATEPGQKSSFRQRSAKITIMRTAKTTLHRLNDQIIRIILTDKKYFSGPNKIIFFFMEGPLVFSRVWARLFFQKFS
jgi:hypothetical protein